MFALLALFSIVWSLGQSRHYLSKDGNITELNFAEDRVVWLKAGPHITLKPLYLDLKQNLQLYEFDNINTEDTFKSASKQLLFQYSGSKLIHQIYFSESTTKVFALYLEHGPIENSKLKFEFKTSDCNLEIEAEKEPTVMYPRQLSQQYHLNTGISCKYNILSSTNTPYIIKLGIVEGNVTLNNDPVQLNKNSKSSKQKYLSKIRLNWYHTSQNNLDSFSVKMAPVIAIDADGAIRLRLDNDWYYIQNGSLTLNDARIFCIESGNISAAILGTRLIKKGEKAIYHEYKCKHSDENISQCNILNQWDIYYKKYYKKPIHISTVTCIHDFPLELVNGYHNEGRVKIGTKDVCYDSINKEIADNLCKYLGYISSIHWSAVNYSNSSNIVNINCNGDEPNSCHIDVSNSFCRSGQGVNIFCQNIKLVGSSNAYEGRVELIYKGEQGLLCDNGFNKFSADTICRQLGYRDAAQFYTALPALQRYGEYNNRSYILDQLKCANIRDDINKCSHNDWKQHNCNGQQETVGVNCENEKIELVNGYHNKGTVRIGSQHICFDSITNETADKLCENLGFISSIKYWAIQGSGNISNIKCNGNGLGSCHIDTSNSLCDSGHVVNLFCQNIKLVGSSNTNEGRVELLYKGEQGFLCDNSFDITGANTICRQLGYRNADQFYIGSVAKQRYQEPHKRSYILKELTCGNNDEDINTCKHIWQLHNYVECGTVGVKCNLVRNDFPLKLVNGHHNEGTVRMGTKDVCFDSINKKVADNLCQYLEYISAIHWSVSHSKSSNFVNINCNGNDPHSCHIDTFNSLCRSGEAVNLFCQNIKLVGSSNANEGRVELIFKGEQGLLCDDEFNEFNAHTICRQLGYHHSLSHTTSKETVQKYGRNSEHYILDDLNCKSILNDINECAHRPYKDKDCEGQLESVGVVCN